MKIASIGSLAVAAVVGSVAVVGSASAVDRCAPDNPAWERYAIKVTLTQPGPAEGLTRAVDEAAHVLPNPNISSRLFGLVSDDTMPDGPKAAWVLVVHDAPLIGSGGPAGDPAVTADNGTVDCTLLFMDPATGAFLYGVQTGHRT